jgi:hypothetical protein
MKTALLSALLPLLGPTVGEDGAPDHQPRNDHGIEIAVYMDGDELTVGSEMAFMVDLHFPDELNASKAGAPAPFLQLDVPSSVRLGGRRLSTYDELAKNEFLMEPYERLLEEPVTAIPFELVSKPSKGEVIGINLVAYVRSGEGRAFFLRRRFELALEPGAEATEVAPDVSSWGPDGQLLQIGSKAPGLVLPDAGGGEVALDDYLGEKNLIVTTYRAHW